MRKNAADAAPTTKTGSPTNKCAVPKPTPLERIMKYPTPAAPAAKGITAEEAAATA